MVMALMLVGVAVLVPPHPATKSRIDSIELPIIHLRSPFRRALPPTRNIAKPTGRKARLTAPTFMPNAPGICKAPVLVVVIVMVELEAVAPFSVSVAGLKEQLDS